jgi:hypothetical protein
MLDRSAWLLVHGADPVRWAKRYGIEPFTAPCYGCDAPLTTSIPFACENLRGLVAPACGCGTDARPPYGVVAVDGDSEHLLRSMERIGRRKRRRAPTKARDGGER